MNNFAYQSQKPEVVAPKIEEILRKDLGCTQPLPFSVDAQDAPNDGMLGAILKDSRAYLFGGKEKLLFTVNFDLDKPQPATIHVNVNRQGIACHAGSVVFSTHISKTVKGEVSLEGPKMFGTSKFVGEPDACAKLNSNKALLVLVDKFARTKSDIGGGMKMERFVKMEPSPEGATLVIISLPRATSMGMSATTDASQFFEIAQLLEQML
ncbi:MAG: hypothetical protein WCQ95_05815 [Bacteroidota bacterium]